ncbi:MAG TPA: prepilin-type N-terminal cleavage/methylation domain-containing protein, partial [Lysobacter sp.]
MRIQRTSGRRAAGFSLIEVMIAVVVLAVGLLALVALQTNLVREGADAKARSRIASLVSSRMDEARAGGYYSLDTVAAVTCASGNDICQAQADAAVNGLSVERTVVQTLGANNSEYKTLTVTARWTDSAGTGRQLAMSTVISPLSLDGSGTLLNQPLSGSGGKSPVVRTSNPATAGVVPIALGDGSSSAASNPTPELVGKKNNEAIVATRFDVLTYVPSSSDAVIQKRIETAVVKCSCQFGAGGNALPEIYRDSQWPAIWTGERYELFKPSSTLAPPGQGLNAGPKAGVVQSALCQECCRDHHDGSQTGVAKFDPERTGGMTKYVRENGLLVEVTNTSTGEYINACRIVRVDGLWRTAADTYARNVGLLQTQSVNSVQAKNGLPTAAATDAYATFVKSYLSTYTGQTGTAPGGAQALFDATPGLNDPATVSITAPSRTDFRYLHARALYVDYLEDKARQKIREIIADRSASGKCPSSKSLSDCIMPYLPFTSANLTEIARWTSSDDATLMVNSGGRLATNPTEPSGGRSYALKSGTAISTATVRNSNSGLAVSTALTFEGVDPTDQSAVSTDQQNFTIGGSVSAPTGADFNVMRTGGGTNPFMFFTVGAETGECFRLATGGRRCSTGSAAPLTGTLKVENYWSETTQTRSFSIGPEQCSVSRKNNDPAFTPQTLSVSDFP